jgi:GT2 family glycosyltransferase
MGNQQLERPKQPGELDDVTAVVKAFQRPESLDRLIRSIRRFYPELPIVVVDDSFEPHQPDGVDYVRLEPDSGTAAGRNAGVERVKTPYFLILDDDIEFTEDTRIERLARIARIQGITLAAGLFLLCRKKKRWWGTRIELSPQEFHGMIERDGDHLKLIRGYGSREDGYYLCDLAIQFFVARTDEVRGMGGWDADLKTTDHLEFFVRLKQHGCQVAYCPDVTVRHWRSRPEGYRTFRQRDFTGLWVRKHGINLLTEMSGRERFFGPVQSRGDDQS